MKKICYIFGVFCMLSFLLISNENNSAYSSTNMPVQENNQKDTNIALIEASFKNIEAQEASKQISKAQKEIDAKKISKGTKFLVRSNQEINNYQNNGTKIVFESMYPEKVFSNKKPQKLVFKGRIIKHRNAQMGSNGGLVKIRIEKMMIDNVNYPIAAMITKINNKPVFFNSIKGNSAYIQNTKGALSNGNRYIGSVYKDPCTTFCNDDHILVSPLYLLSGAILQTSNILVSPIAGLLKPGKNVYIQKDSSFLIKLEEDVFVLNI